MTQDSHKLSGDASSVYLRQIHRLAQLIPSVQQNILIALEKVDHKVLEDIGQNRPIQPDDHIRLLLIINTLERLLNHDDIEHARTLTNDGSLRTKKKSSSLQLQPPNILNVDLDYLTSYANNLIAKWANNNTQLLQTSTTNTTEKSILESKYEEQIILLNKCEQECREVYNIATLLEKSLQTMTRLRRHRLQITPPRIILPVSERSTSEEESSALPLEGHQKDQQRDDGGDISTSMRMPPPRRQRVTIIPPPKIYPVSERSTSEEESRALPLEGHQNAQQPYDVDISPSTTSLPRRPPRKSTLVSQRITHPGSQMITSEEPSRFTMLHHKKPRR